MNAAVDASTITIDTERLWLRPLRPDDLDDFYAYASVPGVGEMAGWSCHKSREESEAILMSMIAGREVLAIVHKADQKMIGTLGLHPVDDTDAGLFPGNRMREIGYVLSKAYWGQGLMAEAVRAAIAYCFQTLKLDALTCCHFVENTQSRRVIEKSGFRFLRAGKFVSQRLQKTFDDLHYIIEGEDEGS
jgi:[ribosomal protein S5]-alanine N-acetyltransferase